MKLTHIAVSNHTRISDLQLDVRGHLIVVGANDVGKTSLLRLLNLLLGSSTGQLYQALSIADLRDPEQPMAVSARFASFTDAERALFYREIDVDPMGGSESLDLILEVAIDPDDPESVVVTRRFPGRVDPSGPSREQLASFGWRYLPATRGAGPAAFDGPNSALRALLRAIEPELGPERLALSGLLENFNDRLAANPTLEDLRRTIATHLSSSMPREIAADDLAIRTTPDPDQPVLDSVSMYFVRDGQHMTMNEQSDGLRQLMSMTLFDLAEGTANVIAIDEPELHLHPASQRTIAELLGQTASQKILVTHSPYIVHRFDPTLVVAISPDGACHQIQPSASNTAEKTLAHWWSPRILEALTARYVILVEGVADRIVVEAAARALDVNLDRIGASVFELGGAENFATVYGLLGPQGFGLKILGLVDEADSAGWIGAFGGRPRDVVGKSIFISKTDLEEEYCRGVGVVAVANALMKSGVAREDGLLASSRATAISTIDVTMLANYCRSTSKSENRKVPSALALAKALDRSTAGSIESVSSLLAVISSLAST